MTFAFNEGVAKVAKGVAQGIINTKGEFVVPLTEYYQFGLVRDGAVSVQNKVNNYGFFDTKGKLIIPFEYNAVLPFYQGYAFAKKSGQWLLIDKSN